MDMRPQKKLEIFLQKLCFSGVDDCVKKKTMTAILSGEKNSRA